MNGNLISLEEAEYGKIKPCNKFPGNTLTEEQFYVPGRIPTRYKGIVGRGTMVSVARIDAVGDMLSERNVVLKLSYQFSARSGIISRHCNTIPAWSDHLPNPIVCSKSKDTNVTFPRSQIRDDHQLDNCTDEVLGLSYRSIRVVVTNRFKNIWEAKSVEKFKRIFVDCLECKSVQYFLCLTYLTYY